MIISRKSWSFISFLVCNQYIWLCFIYVAVGWMQFWPVFSVKNGGHLSQKVFPVPKFWSISLIQLPHRNLQFCFPGFHEYFAPVRKNDSLFSKRILNFLHLCICSAVLPDCSPWCSLTPSLGPEASSNQHRCTITSSSFSGRLTWADYSWLSYDCVASISFCEIYICLGLYLSVK